MLTTYLRRAYSSFAVHVIDVPPRLLAFFLLLLLLACPVTGLDSYMLGALISASVLAMFAASWDLLVGRTGQMSLGHALFFGIGAYSTAHLSTSAGLPLLVTIPLSVLIGVSVGLLIGFPCLRVKGPYLALVTMAFPLILSSLFKHEYFRGWTGGEWGIVHVPGFFPSLTAQQQVYAEYYLALLLLLASSIILYKVANSRTGIVFVSILDDEVASKACGINITRYKVMAFGISGLFATLAGSIQAHLLGTANLLTLALTVSFVPVIVTFVGGMGTIYGPLVGTYIYYVLDKYVLTILVRVPLEYEYAKLLIFTAIVIILIIKWPRGIGRFVTDKLEDLQEERALEERGKRIWKKYERKKKSVHEG